MAIIDLINGIFTGRFQVPVDNRLLALHSRRTVLQDGKFSLCKNVKCEFHDCFFNIIEMNTCPVFDVHDTLILLII